MTRPGLRLVLCLCCITAARIAAQTTSMPSLPPEVPSSATIWIRYFAGTPRGQLAKWRDSAGTIHIVQLQSNPRCQLDVRSTITLDSAEIPTRIDHSGKVCGPPRAMEEHFAITNGRVTWENAAEHRDTTVKPGSFYTSLWDSALETALLARALLDARHPLPLLPGGEGRIERVQEITLNVEGAPHRVTHYRIIGLDAEPRNLWLDEEHEFVAMPPVLIRKGWDSALEPLEQAQSQAEKAFRTELEGRAVRRPAGKLLIHSARVFDAASASIHNNQTIIISGNMIESVRATTARDRSVAGAIDATRLTVLPGLWDSHGHNLGQAKQLIAAGVTTIRILAASVDMPRPHWEPIETGGALEPRLVPIGIIDGPQDPSRLRPNVRVQRPSDSVMIVRTPDDVRRKAEEFAAAGYRQMKMYNDLDPSFVPIMISEAHRHGMRASGHIPVGVTPNEAIMAGLDEVHHINALVFALIPSISRTHDNAELPRLFSQVDLNGPQVTALIALLKERHVTVDPTLVAFEERWTPRKDNIPFAWVPLYSQLPVQEQRRLATSSNAAASSALLAEDATGKKAFASALQLTSKLSAAGISILPGTDIPSNGFALLRELELEVQGGIPPARVLQAATLGAARAMKLDDKLGAIDPGKLADLVLVEGDPTRNISDIRRIRLVIKDGALIDLDVLYHAIGIMRRPSLQ